MNLIPLDTNGAWFPKCNEMSFLTLAELFLCEGRRGVLYYFLLRCINKFHQFLVMQPKNKPANLFICDEGEVARETKEKATAKKPSQMRNRP